MRLFGRVIQDESRRELTFLRESLGLEGYLHQTWLKWNEGKGEKNYPAPHKAGWPFVELPKKPKLELVRQVGTKPVPLHTQMPGNKARSDGI